MALQLASQYTRPNGLLGDAVRAFIGKTYGTPTLQNQFDVVGATTPSAVANSGYHWGTDVQIFIEDQPLYRGAVISEAIAASWAAKSVTLLVDHYATNDFGDTHSLVLLVDSLLTQNTILQLLAASNRPSAEKLLTTVLQQASFLKAQQSSGTQGKAEGDVLENVVNALAELALGPGRGTLKGSSDGNTWWDPTARAALHALLYEISRSKLATHAASLDLSLQPSGAMLAGNARQDFGAYMALHSLSPFALTGLTASKAAGNVSGALYNTWLDDTNIQDPARKAISDTWLQQRGAFLERKNWFGANNLNPENPTHGNNSPDTVFGGANQSPYLNESDMYVDQALGYTIAQGFQPSAPFDNIHLHYFGGDKADTVTGNQVGDWLFGAKGDDNLKGVEGDDYLEGGEGNDLLDGGGDNDTLVGAAGDDTYVFGSNSGQDHIIDFSGNDRLTLAEFQNGLPVGKLVRRGLYESEDGRVRYTLHAENRSGQEETDLVISFPGTADTAIHIRGFNATSHNFGVQLDDGAPQASSVDHVFHGDINKQLTGDLYQLIESSSGTNYVSSGVLEGAEDVINGSVDADSIVGMGGNDGLQGGDGDDIVEGGEGSDLLLGGYGEDTLDGGAGNDHIFGSGLGFIHAPRDVHFTPPQSTGQEIARGFSWVVYDPPGLDENGLDIHEYKGVNVGNLSPGGQYELDGNLIDGGAGDDFVIAGTGNDTVFGGLDNDTVWGLFQDDFIKGEGGNDFLAGDGGSGSIYLPYATWTPDYLHGRDFIDGGIGNDTILGQGGKDSLYGGADDDLIFGDDHNPDRTAFEAHDDDYLDGGSGNDQLSGGGKDDLLLGGTGNDSLWGDLDHSDMPESLQGRDTLMGEDGNDQLVGGGNDDHLVGGVGDDNMWGDDSTITTPNTVATGNDTLEGGAGSDTLVGGRGNDWLDGEEGNDAILGDDSLIASEHHGNDQIFGGAGDDTLDAGGGDDTVDGGGDDDFLTGGLGDDLLLGAEGDDNLTGDDGDDTLVGGSGTDMLSGGQGDDTYRIAVGDAPLYGTNMAETIDDSEGANVVSFAGPVTVDTLTATTLANKNLLIQFGAGDHLLVTAASAKHMKYRFEATSEALNTTQLISRSADDIQLVDVGGQAQTIGAGGADTLTVSDAGGLAYGGRGDDLLSATVAGVDFMYGKGDGLDVIQAVTDTAGPAVNRLLLGEGLSASQTRWSANAQGLKVQWSDDDRNAIVIRGFDANADANHLSIAQLVFSDGTVMSAAQLLARGTDSAGSGLADLQLGSIGNDTFRASAADDTLRGGAGSDTYEWSATSGHDTIEETTSTAPAFDQLSIIDGTMPASLILNRSGNDLLIRTRQGDGSLLVTGHFAGAGLEAIRFADGTQWDAAAILANLTNELTEGADNFTGTSNGDRINGRGGNDTIKGGDGHDLIEGGQGADSIRGEDGNDTLIGDAGSDTLIGGLGDDVLDGRLDGAADTLAGQEGNDTYLFGRGSGQDTIGDGGVPSTETNILRIDPDLAASDMKVSVSGQSVSIEIKGTQDRIQFSMAMPEYAGAGDIDRVELGNGVIWTHQDLKAKALIDAASAQADSVVGFNGADLIDAQAGNDTLFGRGGDDTLIGGTGDDWLQGEQGNDSLVGGQGSDTLYDLEGDNTFVDGETITSGAGNDTFVFTTWQAATITPNLSGNGAIGNDVLILPVSSSRVRFIRDYNASTRVEEDLVIQNLDRPEDLVRVTKYFAYESNDTRIQTIRFADGVAWSASDVLSRDESHKAPTNGDDAIKGFTWSELLDGLDGHDYLNGAQGNDSVIGGGGNDTLMGSIGNDSLVGGSGNDLLFGDDGNISTGLGLLASTDGNDTLDGGQGNDTIFSGGGSNVFVLRRDGGRDIVYGGVTANGTGTSDSIRFAEDIQPTDVALIRDGDQLIVCVGESASQTRFHLYFAPDHSPLVSMSFANGVTWSAAEIAGRVVWGTANAQTGTSGNDTFIVDHTADTITEAANQGQDTVLSSVSYTLAANVENLSLTGFADLSATGNDLANRITGNAGNNALIGGLGADTLIGGQGDDIYHVHTLINGQTGDVTDFDQIQELAGEGTDTAVVRWSYTLANNVENLSELSNNNSGHFVLTGNALNNVITAISTGDTLDGGLGADTLIAVGGGSKDAFFYNELIGKTFVVDNALDVVIAGGYYHQDRNQVGDGDWIQTSVDYTISEGVEHMQLMSGAHHGIGNTLNNIMIGNGQGDVLEGRGGDDTLLGDADYVKDQYTNGNTITNYIAIGADTLAGGIGDDLYKVEWGVDTILEQAGEGNDTVYVSAASTVAGTEISLAPYENVENIGFVGSSRSIKGTEQANKLMGDGSYLTLKGEGGNDVLSDQSGSGYGSTYTQMLGGTGNDTLNVFGSWDTLVGGAGNDQLAFQATAGYSTVAFDLGDGADTLTGRWDGVTIALGAGIEIGDVQFEAIDTALKIRIGSQGDMIQVDGYRDSPGGTYTRNIALRFFDGFVLSGANLQRLMSSPTPGLATEDADVLLGGAGTQVLSALGGDDLIHAGAGDDTLRGGAGSDQLFGGTGDDTYLIEAGDGAAEVRDDGGQNDRIVFGAGISAASVKANKTWDGLSLRLERYVDDQLAESVDVLDYFANGAQPIERIEFADGTFWDRDKVVDLVSKQHGTDADDELFGSPGQQLFGHAGDDTLYGSSGNELLDGGTGIDNMRGSSGDDTYIVDNTSDVVYEESGKGWDTVYASATYTLSGNVEDLILTGGAAINGSGNALGNILTGNDGNNTLSGLGGDDWLIGGTGADSMLGGSGNDLYEVDNLGDTVTESSNAGNDTVRAGVSFTLGANVENLVLTGSTAINGTGNTLANKLDGNGAANVLNGGTGADTMTGGGGDDTYVVDNTLDVIIENADEGDDTIQTTLTYSIATQQNIEHLTLTGNAVANGTGNALNNKLVGNSAANTLTGGGGNDTLDGGTGADSLVGGLGNDIYLIDNSADKITENANEGMDTVISSVTWTLGNELEHLTLTGTATINGTGNALDNWLIGNGAVNTLTGGDGADTLDGGVGADSLVGGLGNDVYVVDNASDKTVEQASAGTDTVQSTLTWTLGANIENLSLQGSAAINGTGNTLSNVLSGNAGNNVLNGAGGNDTYRGNAGNDTLTSSVTASNDTYIWGRGDGVDTLTDAGGTDQLQILSGVAADQVWLRRVGSNLEVSVIGGSDSFVVSNWYGGAANQVESFKLSDGKTLTAANAQNLVEAMATFAPPAQGQTILPANYQSALGSAIAANWS